eukprot:244608-Prorocentrum_minimum.AAC.2
MKNTCRPRCTAWGLLLALGVRISAKSLQDDSRFQSCMSEPTSCDIIERLRDVVRADEGCNNVTRRRIRDEDITGTIPTEVGLLTSLTMIDLSENRLNGTLPVEIGELHALKYLYVISLDFIGIHDFHFKQSPHTPFTLQVSQSQCDYGDDS